jgi:ribonuclease J
MASLLRVTVHRGSHQIGGSCIELATDHHRLLIDAGSPLDDFQPKELPPIPGVSLPGSPPDAVLLSHAHADHSGLLGRLPSGVPVWMTSGTSKMLLAGEVFCGQQPMPRNRQRKLQPGKPERIGDFTVTALPVDHSIFGAVAFLIEAAGCRVLYSGDLRLHGRKPGMTRSLIEAATAAPLDLLLIEGTHLSRSMDATATTEWELENQISDLISGAPGLVLAFFSPQHLDRLVTFYKATRRAGRTLVIDLYAAFVMHLLRSEAGIPDPARGPQLRVYFPQRRRSVPRLERRLAAAQITLAEVLADPSRHVVLSRPSMLKRDLANMLPAETRALYSMWSGYLGRSAWVDTQHAIAATGGKFVECHTSGHAAVPDLVRLIRDLHPHRIIPIHSERPEVLKALVPSVELAEDGQPILL